MYNHNMMKISTLFDTFQFRPQANPYPLYISLIMVFYLLVCGANLYHNSWNIWFGGPGVQIHLLKFFYCYLFLVSTFVSGQ